MGRIIVCRLAAGVELGFRLFVVTMELCIDEPRVTICRQMHHVTYCQLYMGSHMHYIPIFILNYIQVITR